MSSNLDKLIVVHDDFGEGIIKDLKDGIITILFKDDKERKFVYPMVELET